MAGVFVLALVTRLCHLNVLWAEEGLPMAAGAQMARGAFLYRDIWFDKPPLLALVYLLHPGWLVRFEGALYVTLAAALAWRFAREKWGEREGLWAAVFMGFFLTFDFASAAIPLASDLLMLAPDLAAVWLAWRGRAFASGVAAGVAFLFSPKAVFVAAACALWAWRGLPWLAAGFALPNGIAVAWLWWHGALGAYLDQVWYWGRVYAGGTFLDHPFRNAAVRTVNWLGFHGALLAAAAVALFRKPRLTPERLRFAGWALLSLVAVAAGWRFFPRYFFQILPIAVLAAARGMVLLGNWRARAAVLLLLLVPLVRFGPRYVLLAAGRSDQWADAAMDRDSRTASRLARRLAPAGSTLLVWGFRPEMYVYTGMPAASRFLDCQPLTGVPADRHLRQSTPLAPELAAANRRALVETHPTVIMDGLGPLNPRLAIDAYPDLHAWLAEYRVAARTAMTVIYVRMERR